MWYLTTQDTTSYVWHLHKIKAHLAWDITHGSNNINVALIDTWFDINHPDLSKKINPTYDPYDNTQFNTNCNKNNHGTTVASFVAAETDGGGQLASVGFNTNIIPYQAWDGNYLERAHHASLIMGVDIITSSAGGWHCGVAGYDTTAERIAVREIIDNGTIIVMPAGNGNAGSKCGNATSGYTPFYPLHPIYDERIIIVSSTDINDNHTYGTRIHSYFPEVDICAPGYCVMGATVTEEADGSGNCTIKTWPYYGCGIGTSFAAPIVAGTCALMKAANPCLSPAQAQAIIKRTAEPINDENLYPGMLGAGRINTYLCVKEAATRYIQNTNLSVSDTYSAYYIEVGKNVTSTIPEGNVLIPNGTNIILEAKNEVILSAGFEIESNASLEVLINPSTVQSCN
ncbi:MAG: S8 family peptidase [Draconibacterium sp.]